LKARREFHEPPDFLKSGGSFFIAKFRAPVYNCAVMQSPERFHILDKVASSFHASLELDDTLSNVLNQSLAAINASRGAILLRDPDRSLQPCAARGISLDQFDAHPLRHLSERVAETLTASATQDWRALAAPMQSPKNFIGILGVESDSPFDHAELELLNALADHAAVAIQNAWLYTEAQQKLQNLRLLQEISADLTSTLDLDCVLTESLKRVQNVLHVESATILFREGDELVFRIAIGETADRIKPFRLKMGQGFTGWVAEHARGDFTNDLQNDARYYRTVDTEIHFVTRSLIAAPLIVNDQVNGIISATNKPAGFNASDLDLLTTIAGSAAIAIENARLYQVAVEKGRMERELQVARQVQADLLPREMPNFPGWEIAAMWQPAREVSGDYYDFVPAHKNLDIIIGDVSDKGMPAALLMVQTRSILRANLSPAKTMARGVTRANELICASSANDMFVTMACVRLDAKSGKIICVNAGHNRPLICRARDGALSELVRTGVALGIDAERKYTQKTERLQRGDLVVLYTDGVTDAMNAVGEMFGEERLREIVLAHHASSAVDLIAAFQNELEKFIGSAAPADDITVVAAKKI